MNPETSLNHLPLAEEKRQNFQTIKERFVDRDQRIYTLETQIDENENPVAMTIRDSANEIVEFIDYAKCKELNFDLELLKSEAMKYLFDTNFIPKKDDN